MFLIKEFSIIFYLFCFLLFSLKCCQGVPLQLKTNSMVFKILQRVQNEKFFPFKSDLSVLSIVNDGDDRTDDGFSDETEGEDPEVRPKLFQGDIALDTSMLQQLRLGLSWDTFPNRKWLNRTIPYAISNLYDAEDKVKCKNQFVCLFCYKTRVYFNLIHLD